MSKVMMSKRVGKIPEERPMSTLSVASGKRYVQMLLYICRLIIVFIWN